MSRETIQKILDLARWAPSGDNTQPWRFEVVSDFHIAIHGFDTRNHVLYDFDGHASHMAHGALLETLRLAATRFQFKADWSVRPGCDDTAPIYDVILHPAAIAEDPLVRHIESRSVQRRAMKATPLTTQQKRTLVAAVGDQYELQFYDSFRDRFAVARLLWKNAKIRLTCAEAYPVHRDIIEWDVHYSEDRIPEHAVGVDPITAKLMRWVMNSWERVDFFNRYLGGTIIPRVQLDLIPALACAGHVLMKPLTPSLNLEDHVRAGVALQRLWLTCTALGLHLQPEMTPVIFRWYARSGRGFTSNPKIMRLAVELARQFERIVDAGQNDSFSFLCRIGRSLPPKSRSIRKHLNRLFVK